MPLFPLRFVPTLSLLFLLSCSLSSYATNPTVAPSKDQLNKEKTTQTAKAEADVDFGPYMADMQRRIKRAWFPPRGQESRRVKVAFKIDSTGNLSKIRLEVPSGFEAADKAAIQAVENAAPLRPLPVGAPSIVDIEFTFDYNVFAGGKRGPSIDSPEAKLAAAETSGDQDKIGHALEACAKSEMEKSAKTQAISHYARAVSVLKNGNCKHPIFIAETETALGDIYFDDDNYAEAEPLYRDALTRYEENHATPAQLAAAQRDLGYALVYLESSKPVEVRKYFESALQGAQTLHDQELIVDVKQGLGHTYWKEDNYSAALPYYQYVLGQKMRTDPEDFADLGYRTKDVADCLYALHEYRTSLPMYRRAVNYLETAGKTDEDGELVDGREKLIAVSKKLGLPTETNEIHLAKADKAKDEATKKAYAWLPFAFGGALFVLIVWGLTSRQNTDIDISGRNRKK